MSAEEAKNHNKVNDEETEAINSTENISAGKRKLSEEKAASEGDGENNKRRKSEDMEPTTSNNNVLVKMEREETESSNDIAGNGINDAVKIKSEPVEAEDAAADGASTSTSADEVAPDGDSSSTSDPPIAIKTEPSVVKAEPSNSTNKNSQSGADSTVTSSSLRPSCRFGIRCYR